MIEEDVDKDGSESESESETPVVTAKRLSKRTKSLVYIGQAVAIAAVASYGAIKPTGEQQAKVGYSTVAKSIGELQQYVRAHDKEVIAMRDSFAKEADDAVDSCKAEVHAIQMYVAGYLLALNQGKGSVSKANLERREELLRSVLEKASKGSQAKPDPKPIQSSVYVGAPSHDTAFATKPPITIVPAPEPAPVQQRQHMQRPAMKSLPKSLDSLMKKAK
jgi:hypothetical protein